MDNINILPSEITTDILTRVPAESVLDCKLVSRTWKNLIQQTSFSKMHINLHSHYEDSGKLSFLALDKNSKQLHYLEYIENHETPLGRIRKIILTPPFKCHALVGSFNGLLCLKGPKERFCICNPITKEYVILPEPMRKYGHYKYRWTGFGYLPSTNEYKVVLICYEDRNIVYVMVYTLGSGNGWRNIGEFNLQFDNGHYEPGIFANGALHWRDGLKKIIHVFDLADEKFRQHLSPPEADWYDKFGVLDGFLYCAKDYFDKVVNRWYYQIWLHKKMNASSHMKEQTKHHSMDWSKEFTVVTKYSTPLACTKNGGVLCCDSHYPSYFDIFYPKTCTSIRRINFEEGFPQIICHKNTLVSLKELGEEGAKIMQLAKKRKRREPKHTVVHGKGVNR